ncbi:thiamine biosynthesis protein ThiF [Paenibacillus glucanolyticus]|jgi:molybdopterin/thiamine biosynthesis adenylyltransferase|uniref:ThiF family adenylyltransferase n=1 Tax=Paenibacillus TaxID=44249 RepID=UPI0003E1E594|nr:MULTISPECIES: ThiF family adenylyltransferase [Paenibacillus]AVV59051.1 thiamine biosynthesis protein ThiF [Paenibacillus glucanolyticus]ETT41631.1 UBA/THIF-type NAD/FAD-binding protein [Paenibacillus sp. FSL R5-808]MPY16441.1 thiazole biosynthesis adenylyltransferase ThiF [Paenibacillus glucanolyticus]
MSGFSDKREGPINNKQVFDAAAAQVSDRSDAFSIEREHRYSRQERFAPFGSEGQQRLASSHVLVLGAGALGSAVAETLVRAGVGHVTIVDRDYVEWSNLQRQQLFTEQDAIDRLPKAIAAAKRLTEINSDGIIDGIVMDVRAQELSILCQGADLIMDATDNFETRLIVNDIGFKLGIPWIYGGCVGSSGMSYTFLPGETPCLNCLLRTIPLGGDTCDINGILPQAVQIVAAHQTMEAMKLLSGQRNALRKKMLSFDLWRNERVEFGVDRAKKSDCPTCGEHPDYPYLTSANVDKSEVLCGRDTVQIRPARPLQLDLHEVADRLNRLQQGKATVTPYMIIYQADPHRLVIFGDGRTLVHGTSDLAKARTLYHKYVGG